MLNVIIVFDANWDSLRIYSVSVDEEELELLKNVHGTYVNGDMGEKLTKEFCDFFYDSHGIPQKRFKPLEGYLDFLKMGYHSYLFITGFL